MFELVKETQFTHPQLCCRALKALLNILQGQHPEALKYESPTVIGMYLGLFMMLLCAKYACLFRDKGRHVGTLFVNIRLLDLEIFSGKTCFIGANILSCGTTG